MSTLEKTQDSDALSQSDIFHIIQRAQHTGFLAFAVRPQHKPDGFAAFYLSTMSMQGSDNRRFGRIHALSSTMNGDMSYQPAIQGRCHEPDVLNTAIADYLGLFSTMIGPESYSAFLHCLRKGGGENPNHGSLGIYRTEAKFFNDIGDSAFGINRQRLLYPLGHFVQRCRQDEGFFSGAATRPSAVVYNLARLASEIVPS